MPCLGRHNYLARRRSPTSPSSHTSPVTPSPAFRQTQLSALPTSPSRWLISLHNPFALSAASFHFCCLLFFFLFFLFLGTYILDLHRHQQQPHTALLAAAGTMANSAPRGSGGDSSSIANRDAASPASKCATSRSLSNHSGSTTPTRSILPSSSTPSADARSKDATVPAACLACVCVSKPLCLSSSCRMLANGHYSSTSVKITPL